MRAPTLLAVAVVLFVSCQHAAAVDVAFWEAYDRDEGTAGLWHFDGRDADRLADASAHRQKAVAVGPVTWESAGRLGGALAIGGRKAALKIPLRVKLPGQLKAKVHLPPTGTYPLSVEAWIRLDAEPRGEVGETRPTGWFRHTRGTRSRARQSPSWVT